MLIDEIKSECWYVFILIIIIALGMLLCDIGDGEAMWEGWYLNYEYNINCDSGTGFYDAIIKP